MTSPIVGAWGTHKGKPVHIPSFQAGKADADAELRQMLEMHREGAYRNAQESEAIQAILHPDWEPDFDHSNSTKYVGWLDDQRIRALRKLFEEN